MNTSMSKELSDRLLAQIKEQQVELLELASDIKSDCAFVEIPILLDGVFDFIRYNVSEKRFDQLTVCIGMNSGTQIQWSEEKADSNTAYFDIENVAFVEMPIPSNFLSTEAR